MKNYQDPPKWMIRFFRWFCNDHLSDAVLGDLLEVHQRRTVGRGKRMANWLFLCNIITFLQPFAIRKSRSNKINTTIMFKHNFKIATRNLLRNKAYAMLNISGLAIGMASSILILLWVQNELSYDHFHAKSDRLFRMVCSAGDFKAAVTPAGMGEGLQQMLPEIKSALRLSKSGSVLFEVGDKKFEEEHVFYADSNFLETFDFQLIGGDRTTALDNPDGLLITSDMAYKYFGRLEVVGETIRKDNTDDFVVSGVLENTPTNSHLQFDFVLPMSFLARTDRDLMNKVWDSFNFYTYFELADGAIDGNGKAPATETKIQNIYSERFAQMPIQFRLQPLADIHLYSDLQIDVEGHGNVLYVNIFSVVAIFILFVACINFMNLATARSSRRAKEIGLKKVVGAGRNQLIIQFLSEALVISALSAVIAMGMVFLVMPFFNNIADKELSLNLLDSGVVLTLMVIIILTGLLSGSYPALYLSGFEPLNILKGKLSISGGNSFFRNGLVVIQFMVSVVMLVGTVVIYNQLNFIKDRNLGFDQANLLYIPMSGEVWGKQDALRSSLLQNPLTSSFSIISDIPTNIIQGDVEVDWEGKDPNSQIVIPSMRVDDAFIDVFEMEILRGRSFSSEFGSDSAKWVINEKAVDIMGMTLDNAVGKPINFKGTKGTVIGVVKDFNYKPLQYEIEPLVLHQSDYGQVAVVRVQPNSFERTIETLEAVYHELNPAYPFTYGFIDQELDRNYRGEQKMGTIFNLFALLAIIISCIGLYGLSAFIAEQHNKEIGIRKVLGANMLGLINLLSKDFMKLVLLAFIIAAPLSWYLMDSWLDDFVYRAEVSLWIFLLAGFGVLMVTLLTVSHQIIKAALMNPVNSLRSE